MRRRQFSEAKKETKTVLIEFGENTTAHGIPRVTKARTRKGKIFWICVFSACLAAFLFQAIYLIQRYFRHETTTQIELKFEQVVFPAVTICNINPYKKSLTDKKDSLRRALNSYDRALGESKGVLLDSYEPQTVVREKRQTKRANNYRYTIADNRYLYRPVYAMCHCPANSDECVPSYSPPDDGEVPQCICFYETEKRTAWPCYHYTNWHLTWCSNCSLSGRCNVADLPRRYTPEDDRIFAHIQPCICQTFTKHCIATLDQRFDDLWELHPPTVKPRPPPSTTREPIVLPTTTVDSFEESQGFQNMTDKAAIAVKAKVNMMFVIANKTKEERQALSHDKDELIRMCVFNGQECDIGKDFAVHVDPIYGNCYVFNHDARYNKTSRAGPVFGLRLMVYLDVAEYLSVTQDLGARIAVHTHDSYPFPDVFGYNAPAGFTSSFGIRLKKVKRLEPPYGNCSDSGKAADYLFQKYSYSPEGCFRTWRQRKLIELCGCGEPQFPLPKGVHHCYPDDPVGRACLDNALSNISTVCNETEKCDCPQPCYQSVYDVTFSAARWPSGAVSPSALNCSGSIEECTAHLRENAAIVEVYFEQLNCEYLKEFEAYPAINLLADLGGQLGLWLGFSVITVIEILVLLWDLIKICCFRPPPPKNYKEYNGDLYGSQSVEYTLKLRPRSKSYYSP